MTRSATPRHLRFAIQKLRDWNMTAIVHSKQKDSNNGLDEIPFFYWGRPCLGRAPPQGRTRLALTCELKRGLGGDAADDFIADLIEGQDVFSQSGARDKARHAPYDAARVLHDHVLIAGRDPNARGAEQITRLALPYWERAFACKALGQ